MIGRAAGERLAQIAKANNPALDEASLDIERGRFLPAPLTIGVISSPKPHPKVPEFEQLISAGNVAFNLMHAAFALGFAANWVTRWYSLDDTAARMLGAKDGRTLRRLCPYRHADHHDGGPAASAAQRNRVPLASRLLNMQH